MILTPFPEPPEIRVQLHNGLFSAAQIRVTDDQIEITYGLILDGKFNPVGSNAIPKWELEELCHLNDGVAWNIEELQLFAEAIAVQSLYNQPIRLGVPCLS